MPTHLQTAKMNQKKVKITKKDKKEIKRDNLKKQIKKKKNTKKPQARKGVPAPSTKGKPSRRY